MSGVSILCRAVWLVLNPQCREAQRVLWCVHLIHTWLPQAETHCPVFSTHRLQKQRLICWTFLGEEKNGKKKNNSFQPLLFFPVSLLFSHLFQLIFCWCCLQRYVTDIFLSAVVDSAHTHYPRLLSTLDINRLSSAWLQAQNKSMQ